MLPRTCPFFHNAAGSPCAERRCSGGARNTAECRAVVVKYYTTKIEFPNNIGAARGKAVPTTDPACYSMVPRSCPFVASNTGSPCKAAACGSAGAKKSAACRATIVTYCAGADGHKDKACWSFVPKSCPFLKFADGSPCNVGKSVGTAIAVAAAAKTAADKIKNAADAALVAPTKAKTDADAAATKAAKDEKAAGVAKSAADTAVTDAATAKTTADEAKVLVDAAAKTAATKVLAAEAQTAFDTATNAVSQALIAVNAAQVLVSAPKVAVPATAAALACGMTNSFSSAGKNAVCRAAISRYCSSAAGRVDMACAKLMGTKTCPFDHSRDDSPCEAAACAGGKAMPRSACRSFISRYCNDDNTGKTDPACYSMTHAQCPFNKADTSPCKAQPCMC